MSSAARTRRRALALTFATVLTASLAFASTPPASAAQTIGFPTFSGPADPPAAGRLLDRQHDAGHLQRRERRHRLLDRPAARPHRHPTRPTPTAAS